MTLLDIKERKQSVASLVYSASSLVHHYSIFSFVNIYICGHHFNIATLAGDENYEKTSKATPPK
jgi:hypothetical protein